MGDIQIEQMPLICQNNRINNKGAIMVKKIKQQFCKCKKGICNCEKKQIVKIGMLKKKDLKKLKEI